MYTRAQIQGFLNGTNQSVQVRVEIWARVNAVARDGRITIPHSEIGNIMGDDLERCFREWVSSQE
jgi:hypothetical protein